MTNELAALAGEEFAYLTTRGRVSGRPHRIEIWFGLQGSTAYLMSGGGEQSDWVRNLTAQPAVGLEIGKRHFEAAARIVSDASEEQTARQLLAAKYYNWRAGQPLNRWAATALPVAIEIKL